MDGNRTPFWQTDVIKHMDNSLDEFESGHFKEHTTIKALIEITEDELRMLKNYLCDFGNQDKPTLDTCFLLFLGSLQQRIESGTLIPPPFDDSWIRTAIFEATGLQFEDYSNKSNKSIEFFARIIYTHQIRKIDNLQLREIADRLNRTQSNVSKYERRYLESLRFDKSFRRLAEMVDEYLSKVYPNDLPIM